MSRGFTLIELVVVIVILAVLAAVAVPRFVDLGRQARIASVKTMAATVRASAENIHAACLMGMNGCNATFAAQRTYPNGQALDTNFGWPDAGNTMGVGQIDMWVTSTGFAASIPDLTTTRFSADGAPDPAHCAVFYTDAYTVGPTVGAVTTTDTSGC